jgi:autotransporter-associated beta strand protein
MASLLILVIGASGIRPHLALAVSAYWDINGPIPGAGTPSAGTWNDLVANWTSDSSGTFPTTTWTPNDTAVFSAGADATGTFTVTLGGPQSANGLVFEEGNVTISGGTQLTLTGGPVVQVLTPAAATISSVIGGNTGLAKLGPGPLNLAGLNTYTGGTTINAGTLAVNGSIVGGATVNSGGTLGGGGSVSGTVINSGRVAPGNSPGTLTVGNYTQTTSGLLEMEVGGTTTGTFDKLHVTGTASLDGILRIVNQTVIAPGTTIQLLTANSITAGTRFDSVETVGGNGIYFAPTYSGTSLDVSSYSRGDMNRDGDRDFEDVKWFALALVDPDEYEAGNAVSEGGPMRIDIQGSWSGNMDGLNGLDFDDINLFASAAHVNGAMVMDAINQLLGVPEPDSSVLLAFGILGAAAFAYRRGGRLPTNHTRSTAIYSG